MRTCWYWYSQYFADAGYALVFEEVKGYRVQQNRLRKLSREITAVPFSRQKACCSSIQSIGQSYVEWQNKPFVAGLGSLKENEASFS